MPYTHRKVGNKQCVFKKDGGAKVGCTSGSIDKYLGALHANANESINESFPDEHYSSLPKAICVIEPKGENGLEGYTKGNEYRYRLLKTKLGKDYYRVYHDNAYYEICGPNKFKKFFRIEHQENLNSRPSIFGHTIYRLPTDEELKEVNSFNLNYKEILNGFYYTIVGRGILQDKNKNMIIEAINNLVSMYPENNEYKKALIEAKEKKIKNFNIHEMKGGKADKLSIQDIADKFDVPVSQINKQVTMGKKVEMEHTDNPEIAKEISKDHLSEFPDYYTRLAKLEKQAAEHFKNKDVTENTKQLIKRLIREKLI